MPLIKYDDVIELRSQLSGLKEAIQAIESHIHDQPHTENRDEITKLFEENKQKKTT